MKGKDIVPLSEVYLDLQAKRFLLKEAFYNLLRQEADNLLAFANAKKPEEISKPTHDFLKLNELLRKEMDRAFGIEQISWSELETVQR
jgi:hypothetical protein